MKLIDKDALVAEIRKRLLPVIRDKHYDEWEEGQDSERIAILNIIDTLEVKEVDLDFQMFAKEMDIVFALPSSETKNTEEEPLNWEYAIAKHFFELGMAVSSKAQKGESKEPVGKVWHTTMEEPNGEDSIVIVYDNGCTVEPSFKDFKSYSEWGTIKRSYRVKLWAYLDDLLSLSTAERNGKNLKELKTMLDDSLSKETEDSLNEFLDKCESEDLEEAAKDYVMKEYGVNCMEIELVQDSAIAAMYHFKNGVRWQRKQIRKRKEE
jgi:hypothetical protein